ncbi:MAG: hypothetical protein GY809_05840 [Planctomycetes bacterium]|nr:hypothetical protein [Planctomycetota bacterium]
MESIIIRIIDKTNPKEIEAVRGELIGAGYIIKYDGEAEFLGVDANRIGGGEDAYENAYVLLGVRGKPEQ